MKTAIKACGSITKHEFLNLLNSNILPNTTVAEASQPYADYYGVVPEDSKPNSIFIFTRKFYFLEEILSFSQNVEKCVLDNLNLATAIIDIQDKQYPAIRLKYFPDYRRIVDLQNCLMKQGVHFAPSVHLNGNYHVCIHKLFKLEDLGEGNFMDMHELNKGYFAIEQSISPEEFIEINSTIRNNTACKIYDAEQGKIILNGEIKYIIRVFAEGLDIELLKCIQKSYKKYVPVVKKLRAEYH